MTGGPDGPWGSRCTAVVGLGSMGEAIVRMALSGGWERRQFSLVHRRPDRRRELEQRFGGPIHASTAEAVRAADAVLCCVPPQQAAAFLAEVAADLRPDLFVLTVSAGLDIPWFAERLPAGTPVVRAVPPPTTWLGSGLCLLSASPSVDDEQAAFATAFFASTCERVRWIADEHVDVATAIGPAATPYLCELSEALVAIGRAAGLPPDLVAELVGAGIRAGGAMVGDERWPAARIMAAIATPNGLTRAAVTAMHAGMRTALGDAVAAMVDRSREFRAQV